MQGHPMKTGLAMLAAAMAVGVATTPSGAQGNKVGALSNLHAWIDKMPPGPASVFATGMITAPTPCYDAVAEFAGTDKSNPPIYLVKVTLREHGSFCIQVLTDIPFTYQRLNNDGNAEDMTISSEADAKTIPIEITH